MASPEKKSRSIKKKKSHRLTNTDLALAATASADRRKSIIKAAVGGGGYDRYRGVKNNLGGILRLGLNARVPASLPTIKQIKSAVARACISVRDRKNNQSVAEGLHEYVVEHNVTAAPVDLPPVALGRAGVRSFWEPYLLKIDGKKYVAYFDFRLGERRPTREARRFIFSIQNTYIRLANPTEYGDVGFVIFQFTAPINRVRKAVAYFDTGISFWNDRELGEMIDEVYRILDEIRRAA
jgi:hypothetical protein